jgi:hypothetical protein
MSIETMAFILGGLLLAAGVFGGGLEVKEIRLPQIGTAQRLVAAVAGIAFVVLALALNQSWIERKKDGPSSSAADGTKVFEAPMFENLRLDACVEWSKRCGEEAATAWCKTQGYVRAIQYPMENVGERGVSTKLIGTKDVCKERFCSSFSEITCTR